MRTVVVYNGEKKTTNKLWEVRNRTSKYRDTCIQSSQKHLYSRTDASKCHLIITNLQFMKNLENKMLISESKIVR